VSSGAVRLAVIVAMAAMFVVALAWRDADRS